MDLTLLEAAKLALGLAMPGLHRAGELARTTDIRLPEPRREPRDSPRQVLAFKSRERAPPAPPLPPRAAARRFLGWMQDHGFLGEYRFSGPNGIYAYYLWHCHEANLRPLAENLFGEALGHYARYRQARDRSSGRLVRQAMYLIKEAAEPEAKPRRRQRAA